MKQILLAGIAAAVGAVNAAVPLKWTATPLSPPYMPPPVPHGSTIELTVELEGYTSPPIAAGADVRLWFQTNGMGSAWHSAPASVTSNTVSAVFGPAQDTGADRINCFLGAPSNIFAAVVLRLSAAPGFRPNALPLPVQVLDFAAVEIANAPWPSAEDVAAAARAAADAQVVATNAAASASAANVNLALCATKAELNHHANNQNIHVTAAKQAAWNAKQDALPLETGTGASSVKLKVSGNGTTVANGDRAVALGYAAKATGHNAMAANNQTTAAGQNSAAFGYKTTTANNAEFAAGLLNNPHAGTRFSVGVGVNAGNAHTNALEIMDGGDMYVRGVGGYTGGESALPADGVQTVQAVIAALAAATNSAGRCDTAAPSWQVPDDWRIGYILRTSQESSVFNSLATNAYYQVFSNVTESAETTLAAVLAPVALDRLSAYAPTGVTYYAVSPGVTIAGNVATAATGGVYRVRAEDPATGAGRYVDIPLDYRTHVGETVHYYFTDAEPEP